MQTPDPVRATGLAWMAVAACLAGLLLATMQLLHQGTVQTGFDLNHAMETAGREVPAEVESFYFFVPEPGRSRRDEIAELGRLLAQAAAEKDFIGVAGADAERNRAELLEALADAGTTLNGATVVYLGPEAHRAELQTAVDGSGGSLRFVPYPPLPKNAI